MKKNMSSADSMIRLIVAAVLITLFFTHIVNGMLGYILLAVAGIFTLTSVIRFCPLYTLFGISTCSLKK